jgi:hypothetical protein
MKTAVAIAALSMIAGSAFAETIGGYTIGATPIRAQEIVGGGANWDWLNVVNAPVSINDAFSGSLLADDGYANGAAGVTVQCTFAAGDLVNGPGADLIFVDSRFSNNSYDIFIGNDGFTLSQLAAGAAPSGDTRQYFYGGFGPFGANLIVYAFDLSAWGVAPGGVVTDVRFVGLTGEVDPIGFGSLTPTPGALAAMGLGALITGRRRR